MKRNSTIRKRKLEDSLPISSILLIFLSLIIRIVFVIFFLELSLIIRFVFVFVIFFLELSLIIGFVFVFVIFFLELSIYSDVS
jgi:hypothetical protein